MTDTKSKVEELIDRDVDLLYTSIKKTKTKRLEEDDRAFMVTLMDMYQRKEAIEAVTKFDTIELDILEQLLKELKDERTRREEDADEED